MGGAISKQINFVPQMHKEVGMEEHYTAIPLKDISSEIYKELKNVPFFYDTINMSNFLKKICVAKVALFRPSFALCESYIAELNLDEEIFKTNLKSLKQILLDIASLPKTGQPLLEELNTLLDNCYKLVISFSGASKTSPMEKQISFSIQSKDNENVEWTSIAINLPERYEDFYNLNFLCIQDKTVIRPLAKVS